MSKLEKQLRRLIEKNVNKLDKFINRKVKNIFSGERNKKELINLLPIIIENTNHYNYDWMRMIEDGSFVKTEGFSDVFIENMDKFKCNKKIFYQIFTMLSFLKPNDIQKKQIIEKVLEMDYKPSEYEIYEILRTTSDNNFNLREQEILEKYIKNEKTCQGCLELCLNEEIYPRLIYENIDYLLKTIENCDLFRLKKTIITKSLNLGYSEKETEEIIKKIKKKIETKKEEYVKITINNLYIPLATCKMIEELDEIDIKKLDTIYDIVYLIIDDISKNEEVNISEMNILSKGSYSYVLEIGNKVLKIGSTRKTKTFPNNPYIITPLLRKEFPVNDNLSVFVEVTEKVDTKSYISEEELYQLYKKVRDLGLYWTDVDYRNVGRLLKDNKPNWRQKLPLTDERLKLQPYRGNDLLKKGEVAIIDSDYIFENKPASYNKIGLEIEFERRYQNELKNDSQEKDLELLNTYTFLNENHEEFDNNSTRKM